MSTITQVERGGLFEISEATLAELKSSKYYNDDLAPTSISERSWTTYSITMLWVGMAICIPSLSLASGLIGMGVSPWPYPRTPEEAAKPRSLRLLSMLSFLYTSLYALWCKFTTGVILSRLFVVSNRFHRILTILKYALRKMKVLYPIPL